MRAWEGKHPYKYICVSSNVPSALLCLHVRWLQFPRSGLAAEGRGHPSSPRSCRALGLFVDWNSCTSCRNDTGWCSSVLARVLLPGRT